MDDLITLLPCSRNFKKNAISYYQTKAAVYAERYSVRAAGDLLWVRHHAILNLISAWNLQAGSRFLDLGCGPGFLSWDLERMGYRGVGLDASAAMIQICRSGSERLQWTYTLGDVEYTPLADHSFDAVVCAGVIDYLPNDRKLLAEAARLLKPGGKLLLCVTNTFGYTVCLSRPLYWLKKIPALARVASWLRSRLVGGVYGAMDFKFLPRKHRPSALRKQLLEYGFRTHADRYTHYTGLPAPFCTMMSRISRRLDETLDRLDRTIIRGIGSCYIVDCDFWPEPAEGNPTVISPPANSIVAVMEDGMLNIRSSDDPDLP